MQEVIIKSGAYFAEIRPTKKFRFLGIWNNRAEIIALWGVLIGAKWLGLESLFGDAKGIIDWVKNYTLFNPPILSNWMRRIQHLVSTFQQIDFGHIYREQNQIVDLLSKQGITKEPGKIHFATFIQDVMTNVECINFT